MLIQDTVKNFLKDFKYDNDFEEVLTSFCDKNDCQWEIVGNKEQYLIIAFPCVFFKERSTIITKRII